MRACLALAILLCFACSDTTGSYTTGCRTSTVAMSVSSGLTPRFEWTPNCGVEILSVHRHGPDPAVPAVEGEEMWHTRIFLRNDVHGPVTYGEHVPDASGSWDTPPVAIPLVAGETYTVALWVIGNDLSPRLIAGQQAFTP
jgi:hypothetical protein